MKQNNLLLVILLLYIVNVQADRARVIVTTDGEIDDKASMVRLMSYTNDFDLEGLIYVNSHHHESGSGTGWIQEDIKAYGKVYENLKKHDPLYPTPEYLLSLVSIGNLKWKGLDGVGDGKDTEGSDMIAKAILKNDPRPLWILAWGGTNTIGQAIYKVEKNNKSTWETIKKKIRIYCIQDQESKYGQTKSTYIWLRDKMKIPVVIKATSMVSYLGYPGWRDSKPIPSELKQYYSANWFSTYVKNKGPLGEQYPKNDLYGESDSPSFFHMIHTGLRNRENPGWGGWGARFSNKDNGWYDTNENDDNTKRKSGYRWFADISWDWAARLDWCTKSYSDANHHPIAELTHPVDLTVRPGTKVQLDASASTDPDNDKLNFRWWQYVEAGTYPKSVSLNGANTDKANFTVPSDADGKTIHIIVEVKDNGSPAIKRYRRVVVTVDKTVSINTKMHFRSNLNNAYTIIQKNNELKIQTQSSAIKSINIIDCTGRSRTQSFLSGQPNTFYWQCSTPGRYFVAIKSANQVKILPITFIK